MTIKTVMTGAVAFAFTAGAAAGITGLATVPAAPAVHPVVWDIPMPAAPAPDLAGALSQTLNGLVAPGSFASKSTYIQGGLGPKDTFLADKAYDKKAKQGYFPLTFTLSDIDQVGTEATANVAATAANGATGAEPITFVQGPSPSGWQLSKASVLMLLTSLS